MRSLEKKSPELYKQLTEGYFAVSTDDRSFCGRAADLTIEQDYMKPAKSVGGLVHGGKTSEIQMQIWTLAHPACVAYLSAYDVFDVKEDKYKHKEERASRIEEDHNASVKMMSYLVHRNPFKESDSLVNIHTGEVAVPEANPHQAWEVGVKILKKWRINQHLPTNTPKRMRLK